jgi:hypothetical protein
MFNHLKKVNVDIFSVSDFYIFRKKSNRRLEFNDTVFIWSFVSIKRVRNGYKGGGGHVFLDKKTLIYPILSLKKSYFPIYFLSKVARHPALLPIQIVFSSRLSLLSQNPKATNSRVSDYYLTPTQQFSAILW